MNAEKIDMILVNIDGLITGPGRKLTVLLLSKRLPENVNIVLDKIDSIIGLVQQIKNRER